MPKQHEHAYTIYPTTLDTLFQASYSAYMATPESRFKLSKPLVPYTIKRLRLTENPYAKAHCELKAYSDISAANMEGYTADISLFLTDVNAKGTPIVAIEGFSFKSIGTAMTQKPTDVHDLNKLATVKWKRDLDLVDLKTIKQELETPFKPKEQAIVLKLAPELYDFTDISNGFFEAARKKFSDWPNVMRFKRLDIKDDIAKQGFEEESFGGIDVKIHDCDDDDFYNFSTIMSTATPVNAPAFDAEITIDPWSESSVATISKLYRTAFDTSKPLADFKYAKVNGKILVPRYYKDGGRNTKLFRTRRDDFVTKEEEFD
ncbi:hypothetical protein D6C89_07606 [Aureobasidium pullulans]|nr:hypothetical protein D6C89_07606 [Aureobasidium pullulans]